MRLRELGAFDTPGSKKDQTGYTGYGGTNWGSFGAFNGAGSEVSPFPQETQQNGPQAILDAISGALNPLNGEALAAWLDSWKNISGYSPDSQIAVVPAQPPTRDQMVAMQIVEMYNQNRGMSDSQRAAVPWAQVVVGGMQTTTINNNEDGWKGILW